MSPKECNHSFLFNSEELNGDQAKQVIFTHLLICVLKLVEDATVISQTAAPENSTCSFTKLFQYQAAECTSIAVAKALVNVVVIRVDDIECL